MFRAVRVFLARAGLPVILAVLTALLPALPVFVATPVAFAQSFPGGFVELATSSAVRPLLTPAQIQALLPARGLFTFPAPYLTQGIRLTNAGDCGGTDCVNYVGYSYWRNINNHVGSNTMLIFLGLDKTLGGGGPTLFSYDKTTNVVTNLGPLFDPANSLSWASGEGWYFSATRPTSLYLNDGPRLLRYDVLAKTFETVLDVSTQPGLFGTNKIIWQVHSSNDDRVHSATLKDGSTYAELGCFAYRDDTRQFFYFPAKGFLYDECQIDKSGRWLLIKEKLGIDPVSEVDNRIIDLTTSVETDLLDRNGAGGHSDNGYGYMVASDNWNPLPGAYRLWKYGTTPLGPGTVVYHDVSWTTPGPQHVSHANTNSGLPPEQQYACGSGASSVNGPRANEVICFPLDASLRVLVVAPVMTDMNAPGGRGGTYGKLPKGNLDVTGQYFIWTSNTGGGRLDAFIVKVPAQLLTGPADTTAPTVSVTAPAPGSTVAGILAVTASASDNIGVAGVQFKLDGLTLGAEATIPPYAAAWNTTAVPNGSHTLTAVARDAAGNTATSAAVSVTVANVDTTPPVLSSITVSSVTSSGALITWTTNEPADSQVEYGLTTGYGSVTSLDTSLITVHAVTFSGLAAGTLYHYRVRSKDAAGNLATSADLTVTTLPIADATPPTVALTAPASGTTVFGTIPVSASATDNVGVAGVQFLLDGVNLGTEDPVAPYAVSWNTTTAANGSHVLTAVARDSAGNRTTSTPVGVTVSNATPDTTPPVISSIAVASVTSSGVIITWATNEPADSQIEYGLSSGYGNATSLDTQLVTAHVVSLSSLAAGTLYHYRVKSKDAAGNPATSSDLTLTTVGAGGTTPPVISSVAASSITSSTATISWTTNEAADSAVEYGVTMSYGSATPLDTSRVTAHTVTLSSLAAGTLQHYRVKSKDAAGSQAQSADFNFTTTPATTDPPPPQDPGTPPTGTPSAQGSGTASGGGAPGGSGFASGGGGLAPNPASGNASGGTAPDLGAGIVSAGAAGAPIAGPVTAWSGAVPAQTQRVVWSGLVNVTSSGSSLTKISGCDGCADAGAVSKQQITTGDGYLEFTASETSSLRLIGFRNSNGDSDRNKIQFAISLRPGSMAEVRELGIRRTNTTYVRGDVFRIAIVAGTVRYYKNGRLLYISALAPAYPLTVGTSLMSRGATVTNAIISGRLSRGNALPVNTKPPEASIDVSPEGSQEPATVAMSASVSWRVGPLVLNGLCLEGSALPMTGRQEYI